MGEERAQAEALAERIAASLRRRGRRLQSCCEGERNVRVRTLARSLARRGIGGALQLQSGVTIPADQPATFREHVLEIGEA